MPSNSTLIFISPKIFSHLNLYYFSNCIYVLYKTKKIPKIIKILQKNKLKVKVKNL